MIPLQISELAGGSAISIAGLAVLLLLVGFPIAKTKDKIFGQPRRKDGRYGPYAATALLGTVALLFVLASALGLISVGAWMNSLFP